MNEIKCAAAEITFRDLTDGIKSLFAIENVDTCVIGCSLCGRPIHAFHIGKYGENNIIITAAIHAREWITALLVTELVKIYASADITTGGIYFVPLCNPDGVRVAMDAMGGGSCGNPKNVLWKANARGVDLNVNFDADWGGGAQNILQPGPENFIGPCPNSEPEVKALIGFTLKVKPKATIAYHSKGEVIYYGFEPADGRTKQEQLLRDFRLADKIGEITGYTPVKTENSTGGYSDWVSVHLGIPALTIEVGNDAYIHPIGADKLPEILAMNKDVPRVLLDYMIGLE